MLDPDRFRRLPLLGILRGISAADVPPLVEAVAGAGLEAIEITMNTADAPALIRSMIAESNGRLMVGAGTVLGMRDLDAALAAGAGFVVMPTLVPEVAAHCVARGIPVFPGALTPQEIFNAWRAGATMVKVFPSSCFGPAYFREIKGPFADVPLLACGGVNSANIGDWFSAGAAAAAFGGSVFRSDWLAERRYETIGEEVARLVQACRAARPWPTTR